MMILSADQVRIDAKLIYDKQPMDGSSWFVVNISGQFPSGHLADSCSGPLSNLCCGGLYSQPLRSIKSIWQQQ